MSRECGVLMHVTSLPGDCGMGDMGKCAYTFLDFLSKAGMKVWQVLPLNPTDGLTCFSPYSSISAFAGNPWLISLDFLCELGLITKKDRSEGKVPEAKRADFSRACEIKRRIFMKAFEQFNRGHELAEEYRDFVAGENVWLDDYSLFVAVKKNMEGRSWIHWPIPLRDRVPEALSDARKNLKEEIELARFLQFIFYEEWGKLKRYAHEKGISILGDVPIYMGHDSSDVWTKKDIFLLESDGRMKFVSGAPPDCFSPQGQKWGHPLYRWDVLETQEFGWWIDRLKHNLRMFDRVRIDHFRGLVAFWKIPEDHRDAIKGEWIRVPADSFFKTIADKVSTRFIVAEDLGYITDDVREIMIRFEVPGMKILQFAFGPEMPKNPYILHYHVRHSVIYTGTHDNNTALGWYEHEASALEKNNISEYLGKNVQEKSVVDDLICMALMSTAKTVILPMQDILKLGGEARMNYPATLEGNWVWKMDKDQYPGKRADQLKKWLAIYGR